VEALIKTDVVQAIVAEEEEQGFANIMLSGLFFLVMLRGNMVSPVHQRL
jgi:hypothetical protein